MKLFTIGYEGCDIDEFAEFLHSKKIRQVADLRKNPVSRKRGFSKNKLAENLAAKKISYLHFPTLGVPREWRQLAKDERISRKKMFKDYVKKVLPVCHSELRELLKLAKSDSLALLCYECDATDCHRHFAAAEMKKLAKQTLEIRNLEVPKRSLGGTALTQKKSAKKKRRS